MNKLSVFILLLGVLVGVLVTYRLQNVPSPPKLDLNRWWGAGEPRDEEPRDEDTSVRPFRIVFNDTMIEDLRQRLRNRRPLTKPLEGIQSEYGINTDYLNERLNYWAEKYDFKKRAELLNQFPHFKTKIQGLDIHFIRVTPKVTNKKILPLLILHGWPSSSKEFVKIIPKLTQPRDDYDFVFEVVAPDLPGFGFSEGTTKPGLNPVQIGIIMRNLMKRLGFQKFYIQAGDWGSQCATHIATLLPHEVLGFHTNMPISSRPISVVKIILGALAPWLFEHSERLYPLRNFTAYVMREFGYFHIQATKPDTIGTALTDSPVGLAGYLMEKIGLVSDKNQLNTPHGGLENLDPDDVLDVITIVWANNCIVTATRIYAEAMSPQWPEIQILHNIPTPVPTAAINFLNEVIYQPDWVLRDKFPNLVRSTTLDFGGHFAGLQTPKALVDDIFASTAEFIKFHKEKEK